MLTFYLKVLREVFICQEMALAGGIHAPLGICSSFLRKKDKSKKIRCGMLQFLLGTLRVKRKDFASREAGCFLDRETKTKMKDVFPWKMYTFT